MFLDTDVDKAAKRDEGWFKSVENLLYKTINSRLIEIC